MTRKGKVAKTAARKKAAAPKASRGNLGKGPSPSELSKGGRSLRLGTAKNVSAFLSVVMRKLWDGPEAEDWDPEFIERARVLAYIAQLKLKAIDATETEKRLKTLEARLESMPAREGMALQ